MKGGERMENNRSYREIFTEEAEQIISKMTLEEKVRLMSGTSNFDTLMSGIAQEKTHYNYIPYPSGGNEKYGIPPIRFCDGSRGVVCGVGKSTCYPVSMLRGATFDSELEERIGHAIGEEVNAYGGNLFGGVCINIPYNPGWGRSQESYGEDSFAVGEMGAALVRGVQKEGVIACVKHYAFNSMEISRFKVNVTCSKRTEREVFLPHFKKCIDAGAAAVMSAYNLYEGIPCGHHNYLINNVLKNEWKFDGFVMSDFLWGIKNTEDAANGGQDMEMCCTAYYGPKLVNAVKEGKVSETVINKAAIRIVRTILAFNNIPKKCNEKNIGSKKHVMLALKAAREGITLLKNENQTLPLIKNRENKILILGKLGQKGNIGDHGSSRVFPQYVVSPAEGIANIASDAEVICYDGKDLGHAKMLAQKADVVIFVVGYNHDDEGEFVSEITSTNYTGARGGDRTENLRLPLNEVELIQKVAPFCKKSVVCLIGGNTIIMTEWIECVDSVLMCYYPGQEGGTAIAEILFGYVNPSGKLPYVVPYSEKDLPQVNWNTREQFYEYYHGYTRLDKYNVKPMYPYGYGLSYTTFKIADIRAHVCGKKIEASCNLKNTGDRAGDEVVQMYVGFSNSEIERPVKLLRGFLRVHLQPGDEKRVKISCDIDTLRWYNPESESWEIEHMEYQIYLGTSADEEQLLKDTIKL